MSRTGLGFTMTIDPDDAFGQSNAIHAALSVGLTSWAPAAVVSFGAGADKRCYIRLTTTLGGTDEILIYCPDGANPRDVDGFYMLSNGQNWTRCCACAYAPFGFGTIADDADPSHDPGQLDFWTGKIASQGRKFDDWAAGNGNQKCYVIDDDATAFLAWYHGDQGDNDGYSLYIASDTLFENPDADNSVSNYGSCYLSHSPSGGTPAGVTTWISGFKDGAEVPSDVQFDDLLGLSMISEGMEDYHAQLMLADGDPGGTPGISPVTDPVTGAAATLIGYDGATGYLYLYDTNAPDFGAGNDLWVDGGNSGKHVSNPLDYIRERFQTRTAIFQDYYDQYRARFNRSILRQFPNCERKYLRIVGNVTVTDTVFIHLWDYIIGPWDNDLGDLDPT